jgi:CheY-like chemotaxis protein
MNEARRSYLIVDDNLALAENFAEIIEASGEATAAVTESGAVALQLAAATRFNALLSDVRMPEMSGVELAQRMRLVDRGLPVVLVTAYSSDAELASAKNLGFLAIEYKPAPITRLLALLANARRDGVVALVGQAAAQADDLAASFRLDGFSLVNVASLADAAALETPLMAVVVDFRTLTDAESISLLLAARALPRVPLFAVDGPRLERRRVRDEGIFTTWSSAWRVMHELRSLSDGRAVERA